ncbi:MAG: helix-turn-helix domain-containing protein [Candidatus ainarchaeum sp.]|nr:helix-turn-helix domain-containing protein [Candidatus ainarchaeum sp.]
MEPELKSLGLTDKEIKVYLALLNLGIALVNDIAKKAGTYRTYTYEVLKSLKEKGLVSHVIKSGKQYYEVAPPEKWQSILKEKEQKFNKILPELKKIYSITVEKPRTEVYEGKEGLKTVLDDMLKTKKTIYVYGNTKKMWQYLQTNFPQFILKRSSLGIKTKIVDVRSKEAEKINTKSKVELREMRFLPKQYEFSMTTNIYGNKVAMLSFQDEFVGIIIENKSIAESQKVVFDFLWSSAKP